MLSYYIIILSCVSTLIVVHFCVSLNVIDVFHGQKKKQTHECLNTYLNFYTNIDLARLHLPGQSCYQDDKTGVRFSANTANEIINPVLVTDPVLNSNGFNIR